MKTRQPEKPVGRNWPAGFARLETQKTKALAWSTDIATAIRQSSCRRTEEPPAFDPITYRPSTWPGSRLPSTVLLDGTLLYERLGPWFTLVIFGRVDVGAFEEVTKRCGMPATVLRLADVEPGTVYERHLLLVRPDHHVAWRGDRPPADWHSIVARACGQLLPAE